MKTVYWMSGIFVLLLLILWLFGAFDNFSPVGFSGPERSRERGEIAEGNEGDILIGLEGTWSDSQVTAGFLAQGIQLAIEEVNSSGGVMKRKLKPIWLDNQDQLRQAKLNAQQLAENLNVVAVIGDLRSEFFLSTSVIYRFNGLVAISPGCSSNIPNDTKSTQLIFTTFPCTNSQGKKIAEYVSHCKVKKMVIYHSPDIYGQMMANSFDHHAFDCNIDVVKRGSYPQPINVYVVAQTLKKWKSLFDFDSIYIAGEADEAALIVNKARELGIETSFFGCDTLDGEFFLKHTGKNSDGTVIASVFDIQSKRPEVQKFVKSFKARFGYLPDAWAAQGYDCVNVLVGAMKKAKSTVPAKIGDALKKNVFCGVTNPDIEFNLGRLKTPRIFLKKAEDGKFVTIK